MQYLILFFTLFGVALLLPGLSKNQNDWLGFRFFAAVLGTPLYLFLGNVVLGVPITGLAWLLATVGISSVLYSALKIWPDSSTLFLGVLHPVILLTLSLCLVAVFKGGIHYLPFPGDEIASWLKYARQIYVVDSFWTKNLNYHLGGYTNGWPLYVAFSNVFFGEFSDSHAAILPFFMHVGLLGFVFDTGKFFLKRYGATTGPHLYIFPWTLVFLLLGLESSWILFPTFQVVDHPLLYAFLGIFLVGLLGQFDEISLNKATIYLGLLFSAGYLIKITMLAAGPVLGIFWLAFLWRHFRAYKGNAIKEFITSPAELVFGAKLAIILLGPLGAVALAWSLNRFGYHCFSSPLTFFTSDSHSLLSSFSISVARVMSEAIFAYILSFKFFITLASCLVLILCMKWIKVRWLVLAIITFLLFYVLIIHSVYYMCVSPFGEHGLQSLQRYYRPNLRLLHFIAPILGFYVLTELIQKYSGFGKRIITKPVLTVCVIFILVSAGNQIHSLSTSLGEISTRNSHDNFIRKAILTVQREAEEINKIIEKRGLDMPSVSVIAQSGYNVEIELAQYFGIKSQRAEIPFHYRVELPYSWGVSKLDYFTRKTSERELQNWWRRFQIVWPIRTDKWTRKVLENIVNDKACAKEPEDYFLINQGDGTFECVAKSRKSNLSLD